MNFSRNFFPKTLLGTLLLVFSLGACASGPLTGRWVSADDPSYKITFGKISGVRIADHRTDALKDGKGRYRYRDGILTLNVPDLWEGTYRVTLSGDSFTLTTEKGHVDRFVRETPPTGR